ncbi:adenine deaminase [Caldalkalibacillus salinus]|uniref:adenine deaminase n=1 Tax=Caldalkalibacillus salinus TaxID=2803787 RepID=UPI001920C7D7|nr:adenine deaminase [Caldalkalibacillus salinus]
MYDNPYEQNKHKQSQETMKRKIDVAAKRRKAETVIKNGQIVDVFNQELIEADVAIQDGSIVGIGQYDGEHIINAQGKYIAPSFIDSHVHIESSMVTPQTFAKVVLPHGVTTIIADPHEIANVAGAEGIQYMLDSSENLALNVYMMVPSCVPATRFQNAGAVLKAEDIAPFYQHPRVLGLGEVMDYPSVNHNEETMVQKLYDAYIKNVKVDGHAAGLGPDAINVYMTAGIRTDHESISVQEAKDRLQRGMYLIIRQGSVAKDLPQLIDVITDKNARRCLFGTDDKHIDDLVAEGSINHNVKLAIQHGVDPINAIQMASLSAAECYGLDQKGAIAPGYDADLLILSDLRQVEIEQVFSAGKRVAEKGKYIAQQENNVQPPPTLKHRIRVADMTTEQLNIHMASSHSAHIIGIVPNRLVTEHLVEDVQVDQGLFQSSVERDQLKLAVIERHHQTGNVGLGIVKGLGIKKGAIATTIAHDSHNIITAGTNDQDMLYAVKAIKDMGGGLVIVENEKVVASLALPIAGLISGDSVEQVHYTLKELKAGLRYIGASMEFNPFLTLSFLALPVIPDLKITDKGLFDVINFKHIDVEVNE